MREIQDLTINVERGNSSIETQFAQRKLEFEGYLTTFKGGNHYACGIRTTLIPTSPLYIHQVHRNTGIYPPNEEMPIRIGDAHTGSIQVVPRALENWIPTLRGTHTTEGRKNHAFRRFVGCDGTIEYLLLAREDPPSQLTILPNWVMAMCGNAFCGAERFRQAAAATAVEYALGLEVLVLGVGSVAVGQYGGGDVIGSFSPGRCEFPIYSIGQRDEFSRLAALVERDFWNAAGKDWPHSIEIDFSATLKKLGLDA